MLVIYINHVKNAIIRYYKKDKIKFITRFIFRFSMTIIFIIFWRDILDFTNVFLSHVSPYQIPGRNSFYWEKAAVELKSMKGISPYHQSQLDAFFNYHKDYLSNVNHWDLYRHKHQAILDVLAKCYENQNYQPQNDFPVCKDDFMARNWYIKKHKICKLNQFYNQIIDKFINDLQNCSRFYSVEAIEEKKIETLTTINSVKK